MRLAFVVHPEATIDPTMPVPRWRLSERGTARMRAFAEGLILEGTGQA